MTSLKNVIKIILLFLFLANTANASDIFTEKNISINSQGKSAKEAKEAAVLSGEKEAFKKIILKLSSQTNPNALPKISDNELSDMVQAFEIKQERISRTSYSAILDISFNQSIFTRFLQNNGISFAANNNTKSILLLPILYQNGAQNISLSTSPWNAAWISYIKDSDGSENFIIARGDNEDISYMDFSNEYPLTVNNEQKLKLLLEKYRAYKILLIEAKFESANKHIEISTKQIFPYTDDDALIENFDSAELSDIFLKKIVSETATSLRNKKETSAPIELSKISLIVPFSGLQEWSALSKKLRTISFISKIDQKQITVSSASLDIYYSGSIEELKSHLSENGLAIETHNESHILVTSSTTATPQPLEQQGENEIQR